MPNAHMGTYIIETRLRIVVTFINPVFFVDKKAHSAIIEQGYFASKKFNIYNKFRTSRYCCQSFTN